MSFFVHHLCEIPAGYTGCGVISTPEHLLYQLAELPVGTALVLPFDSTRHPTALVTAAGIVDTFGHAGLQRRGFPEIGGGLALEAVEVGREHGYHYTSAYFDRQPFVGGQGINPR